MFGEITVGHQRSSKSTHCERRDSNLSEIATLNYQEIRARPLLKDRSVRAPILKRNSFPYLFNLFPWVAHKPGGPRYRRFPDSWTQFRASWVRGRIAAGLGDAQEAERLFRETRDGFIRQGIGYDVATVSLDLTLLYLREGRASEVRRLAEETVVLFEAQEVHREALAALLLLREAARREEVTVALVREVAERLAVASSPSGSRPHNK